MSRRRYKDDFVAILKTEYSTAFDEHRKKAMITNFYRCL